MYIGKNLIFFNQPPFWGDFKIGISFGLGEKSAFFRYPNKFASFNLSSGIVAGQILACPKRVMCALALASGASVRR